MSKNILVVDDEIDICFLVKDILEDEGYDVHTAHNGQEARQMLDSLEPDLILMDVWMPDVDGISLLKEWNEQGHIQHMPVIMMSGHGNIETAVEATRYGAYDFLEKPLSMAKLLITVEHALKSQLLSAENAQLKGIQVQSLNQQPDVIIELLNYYVDVFVQREKLHYRKFSIAAQNHLRQYHWPGNVLELKNLVHELLTRDGAPEIGLDEVSHLTLQRGAENDGSELKALMNLPLKPARELFEKQYLEDLLKSNNGNVSDTAQQAEVERTYLYRKLKALGIDHKQI